MRAAYSIAGLLALLWAPACLADEMTGLWKVDEQPAWVEVAGDGHAVSGTIRRQDARPEMVGRVILKDVEETGDGAWKGQIFVPRLGSFRDASIELDGPDTLLIEVKVGFMSRTVSWSRAESAAAE